MVVLRREALRQLGVVGAGLLLEGALPGRAVGWLRGPAAAPIVVAGREVEVAVWAVSDVTVRIMVLPLEAGRPVPVADTGAMAGADPGRRVGGGAGGWLAGGREVERAVGLGTIPLYVRAGAVLPLGPVKQYADELSEESLSLTVYPGASGASTLYDDDGVSFGYRRGENTRLILRWGDARRRLTISVAPGARTSPPALRRFEVRMAGAREVGRSRSGGG